MATQPGRFVKVYIDLNRGGGAGASWSLIAQQENFSIKEGTKVLDGTTKDDDGSPNDIITGDDWSASFGGKLSPADPAYIELVAVKRLKIKTFFKFDDSLAGGTPEEGQAIIDSLERKADVSGAYEYTASLKGQGVLSTAVV